jgi:hypothetical protein
VSRNCRRGNFYTSGFVRSVLWLPRRADRVRAPPHHRAAA